MFKFLLALLILVSTASLADARRHRHHHHRHSYTHASSRHVVRTVPDRRAREPAPEAEAVGTVTPDRTATPTYGDPSELVPRTWKLQPPDPKWDGRRFMSPDGAAWAAAYAKPVGSETIATHLKIFAFVDGEAVTFLRGGRDWIVVSGRKGERFFYRKAVLACAGRNWHQIAFEYPREEQQELDPFITRAADALDHTANDGCGSVVSRQ